MSSVPIIRVGPTRPNIVPASEALQDSGYLPSAGQTPGWAWAAHRKRDGHLVTGWTKQTYETPTRESLRLHLALHYRNLSFSNFKCVEQDGPPQNISRPPNDWYEVGTRRMVAEYRAGVRPLGYSGPLKALPGYKPPAPRPAPLWSRGGR